MTHHILVVEDNVSTRELYIDILEAYDFKVEVLLNGQEVLDYFDSPDNPRPDLLMLDINLPEKNGVYVLKYLRGKLKLHTQKILVITANHIAGQMPEMELANHIMTKPFLPKQLKETIDMVLSAPETDIKALITGETEPIIVTRETTAVASNETDVKSDEPEPDIDPHKADTVETKVVGADDVEAIEADEIAEDETAKVDSATDSTNDLSPPTEEINTTDSAETAKSEAVTVETETMTVETVAGQVSDEATESTTPESPTDIATVEEKAV